MIRWTTVPNPPAGYQLRDAEEFLAVIASGWTSGERLGWTIEGQRGPARRYCGRIDLRLEGDGIAEVGFGLHPEARGRSMMIAALHLVLNYGFNVAGLQVSASRIRKTNAAWVRSAWTGLVGMPSGARSDIGPILTYAVGVLWRRRCEWSPGMRATVDLRRQC